MKKIYLLILVLIVAASNVNAQNFEPRETAFVNGEVLIQLRKGYAVEEVMAQFPEAIKMHTIKNISKHMLFWHLGFDSLVISNRDVLRKLMSLPSINLAQNNHYIQDRATVPNDVSFTSQWYHKNTGVSGGTVDADIDSDDAWDITKGGVTSCGDTIVVALVEPGGAYWNHNDLLPNMWHNYAEIPGNSLDDDGNGYIDDIDGWNVNAANDNHPTGSHGTNCFGMMGAKGNNTTGVAGINWNLKVMLVSNFGVTEAGCIAAYDYPLNMRQRYNNTNGADGAFVVASSSSWGIDNADPLAYPLWCAFYDTCGVYGILSVGATTNNTVDVDVVGDMPTACSSNYMVSVTRTGNTDNQAGGYGVTTIDFGAPGINVYTTSGTSTSTYTTTTGTSFSCPLTAGTIALCYSVPCVEFMSLVKSDPQAGADFVFNALKNNVDITAAMTGKSVTNGRLNAFKAVNYIYTTCTALPTPTSLTATGATTTSVNLNWVDGGTSAGFYYYYRIVGAPTWDSVYTTNTSATVTGLTACNNYQTKVASYVCNNLSAYSTIVTFNTNGGTPGMPTGLTASAVTTTSATLNWVTGGSTTGYYYYYRLVGAPTWDSVYTTSTSATLTGLTSCSDYQSRVAGYNCIKGAYSTTTNFNTIGNIPTGLNGTVLTDTTASITWGSVSPSIGYNIQYKLVSAGSFTLITSVTSPYTLTGLLPCNDYEVQVQTVCNSSTTAFSASDFFSTTCLGFDDVSGNSQFFSIYPNPASGEFTLNLSTYEAATNVTFSLVNTIGEVVQINTISSKTTLINVGSLTTGVYTYIVKLSDNTLRRGKLVIRK